MTQPDPELFMNQFTSWEVASKDNKWQGRNITRWQNKEYDDIYNASQNEVDPVKRKALYAQFVKEVNTELPVWMPIEQIFVTVITAKARNHSNTPRWGSTSWHDLWLSA